MKAQDINRRTMLALAGAGVLGSRLQAAQAQLSKIRSGHDSPLLFFDHNEFAVVDTLAEMIIPADEHSPGARQARVAQYIDLVVANSPAAVQSSWRKSLTAFTESVKPHATAGFASAPLGVRNEVVTRLMNESNDAGGAAKHLLLQVKEMTIFGYYSSEIGLLKELEYKGNQVMAMFPGCEASERRR